MLDQPGVRIVDILIEKKCMNPIIFIDELDKVSRTEHGKEIIGILTHLVDSEHKIIVSKISILQWSRFGS